jgi:ribose transport system substrate-binding protein
MKRIIVTLFTVAFLVFVLAATYGQSAKYPYGPPPWTIGMAQDTMDHPWRAFMVTSMAAEAKKYPNLIKRFVYTDAKGTNEKQISDVEDLIAQKCNLILMSPREARPLQPAVEAIKKAKIPLVVVDREIVGEDYVAFIGGDNYKLAKELAEWVVKKEGTKWNWLEVIGVPGSTPQIQRHEGFIAITDKNPGIKRLEGQVGNFDLAPTIPIMEDWLTKYKKGTFQVIYAQNDPQALACVQVLKASGQYKPGEICVLGVDGQREAFEAIKEGWISATSIYATGGAEALRIALKVLKGEPVPKRTITETPIVSAENVDQYYDPNEVYVR